MILVSSLRKNIFAVVGGLQCAVAVGGQVGAYGAESAVSQWRSLEL
jgi:hypothetical protein